jgi:membrane-bound metal-dependent hydrolase YbcI (DUF457 family)
MPLPIAHGLLGAAVVAVTHERTAVRRGWPLLVGATLALCPDVDFLLGAHRTYTHSLAFALGVTGVLRAALGRPRARAAAAYGLAFMSHGLLDYATTDQGRGVTLLWPLSAKWCKLGLVSFSEFHGGFPLMRVLERSLVEAVVFTPVLLTALFLRFWTEAEDAGPAVLRRDQRA